MLVKIFDAVKQSSLLPMRYLKIKDFLHLYNYTNVHLDPPMIWPMGTKRTIEGRNLSVTCSYTLGEPTATTVYWTKSDSVFRYDGQMLWIPNIEKEDSGTYVCHAENTYSSGNRGTANTTIQIDVQCQSIRVFMLNLIFLSKHFRFSFLITGQFFYVYMLCSLCFKISMVKYYTKIMSYCNAEGKEMVLSM